MNLFQQYGIKEVADVVFYSINKIGDEEFYTPVLYLDTLKVSTIEKTAQKVSAQGGLGNKKLITWNYGKELTLNLEDALFSPASMSMIWGGVLNSVLSDITSTIVKSNVANKYGEKNYSTKAYPSPALNDRELALFFNAASQANYDILGVSKITTNLQKEIDDAITQYGEGVSVHLYTFIDDNYGELIEKGKRLGSTGNTNFDRQLDNATPAFRKETIVTFHLGKSPTEYQIKKINNTINEMIQNKIKKYGKCTYHSNSTLGGATCNNNTQTINFQPADKNNASAWRGIAEYSYQYGENSTVNSGFKKAYTEESLFGTTTSYQTKKNLVNENSINFVINNVSQRTISNDEWKEKIKTNYDDGPISKYLQTLLLKKYYSRLPQATTQAENHNEAVEQKIINVLMTMLHTFDDIGKIETEMYDVEVLDRMEKCIVKSRHGFTISRKQQLNNLKRYYLDDRTSSYTIYYDPKTMLPLLPYIADTDSFGNIQVDATTGQVEDITDDDGNSIDKFKIKVGTVYYKWTRSVKYKSNDDTGILGRSFVIDAETFPDYYKIVGETYIRNRKTGKDQRYQFVINRAQVSSDTNITLEAEGDPTTFSMQIDVLTPPNDVMMELKQYDVEEDKINGGFSVVPQKSEYTYTPAWKEPEDMQAPKNDEVY